MKRRAIPSDAARAPGLSRAVETGPRIFLRYLAAGDRDEFMALKRASRKFLEPWEATPPSGLDTFSLAYFARLLANRRNESNHRFVICRRSGEAPGRDPRADRPEQHRPRAVPQLLRRLLDRLRPRPARLHR